MTENKTQKYFDWRKVIYEPELIPETFNVADYLLDRHLHEGRGDKIAIYYGETKITYAELAAMANRFGNAMRELGIERENRVVICLRDRPEFIGAYFGIMKLGAVPVPLNTMVPAEDYVYYLNDSRAKVIVVERDLWAAMAPLSQEMQFLQQVIVLDEPVAGCLHWDEVLAGAADELEAAATSKDDMAFWLYSSGTTGKPKAVVHLHHDLLYFIPPFWEEVLKLSEDDLAYSSSKLYFSYGRNNSLDAIFLVGSAVVLYPDKPEPEKLVKIIETYRPTVFYSVPSSYSAMIQYVEQRGTKPDFSSLRACMTAGEALPPSLLERWKKHFDVSLVDALGSTDVGAVYVSCRPEEQRPGATGKLLSGYEARLLLEDETEAPLGQIGTIWLKNDGITPGYWNQHAKTKQVLKGDWFNTGDQFYQDEDGYYYYAGRENDMLKAGGIWLSPLEVEDILLQHPAVFQCAVIGAPDQQGLEKPMAFVILQAGHNPSADLEKELQEHVRSNTAHYKYPRWVRFVDDLPRTASGKVQRYKLRQLVQAKPAI